MSCRGLWSGWNGSRLGPFRECEAVVGGQPAELVGIDLEAQVVDAAVTDVVGEGSYGVLAEGGQDAEFAVDDGRLHGQVGQIGLGQEAQEPARDMVDAVERASSRGDLAA